MPKLLSSTIWYVRQCSITDDKPDTTWHQVVNDNVYEAAITRALCGAIPTVEDEWFSVIAPANREEFLGADCPRCRQLSCPA